MKTGIDTAKCPLCGYTFSYGVLGWDAHVARLENHPSYHPKVVLPEARKRLFQQEFPDFFDQAKTRRSTVPPARRDSGFISKVEKPKKKASS